MHNPSAAQRVEEHARAWSVTIERMLETPSSILAFGARAHAPPQDRPVVLKVIRSPGDEWNAGEVLCAFAGHGMVRVYESAPGAMLLQRLDPGSTLSDFAGPDDDDEATDIISDVITRMSPARPAANVPSAEDWGRGFDQYIASGDRQIDEALVTDAHRTFRELCETQRHTRLLHGDLHHYNVLSDRDLGWTAIDPKGVVGEAEYEIGAALRNPGEKPELFTRPDIVRKRVARYTANLGFREDRVVRWAFAQAVLSAIWFVEDGYAVAPDNAAIMLAKTIQTLL